LAEGKQVLIYELVLLEGPQLSDDLLFHDNPLSALKACALIREQFGKESIVILKDGIEISETQVVDDLESYEIQSVVEESTHLPSTYRPGRGGDSDLALGADGKQHGVWRPKNPEDDFS
jgi:hypothetical protein